MAAREGAPKQIVVAVYVPASFGDGGRRKAVILIQAAVPGKAPRFRADTDDPEIERAHQRERCEPSQPLFDVFAHEIMPAAASGGRQRESRLPPSERRPWACAASLFR